MRAKIHKVLYKYTNYMFQIKIFWFGPSKSKKLNYLKDKNIIEKNFNINWNRKGLKYFYWKIFSLNFILDYNFLHSIYIYSSDFLILEKRLHDIKMILNIYARIISFRKLRFKFCQ